MPSIWDHDKWRDIYAIEDPETKNAMIQLYELILDMHNKDVLSEQIADALKGERKLYLSNLQKFFAFLIVAIPSLDILFHVFHKG